MSATRGVWNRVYVACHAKDLAARATRGSEHPVGARILFGGGFA
jgi:hypothetical protein